MLQTWGLLHPSGGAPQQHEYVTGVEALATPSTVMLRGNVPKAGWCPSLGLPSEESLSASPAYSQKSACSVCSLSTVSSAASALQSLPAHADALESLRHEARVKVVHLIAQLPARCLNGVRNIVGIPAGKDGWFELDVGELDYGTVSRLGEYCERSLSDVKKAAGKRHFQWAKATPYERKMKVQAAIQETQEELDVVKASLALGTPHSSFAAMSCVSDGDSGPDSDFEGCDWVRGV